MSRKQLLALFICNLIAFMVINSLMALLPIYISDELGAGSFVAGIAISIAFAAFAVSTSSGANISRHLGQRTSLIRFSAVFCMPILWLMGQTQHVIVFTILLGIAWFFAGIQVVMVQILTALKADPKQRGRVFGLLIAAGSLSKLIGGLAAGRIVSHWGYETLFMLCASLYILSIFASYSIDDNAPIENHVDPVETGQKFAGYAFVLLVSASIFAYVASFSVNMASPLLLGAMNFDTSAITGVVAVSGLITLPLPVLAGWLSDRFGRKPVLIGAYLLSITGIIVYMLAANLWQFWIAQALLSVLVCSIVVGTALVTDIVPLEHVDSYVGRFTTTPWIGAIIGSTTGGFTMDFFGATGTFEIAIGLMLVALVLASFIHSKNSVSINSQPVLKPVINTSTGKHLTVEGITE